MAWRNVIEVQVNPSIISTKLFEKLANPFGFHYHGNQNYAKIQKFEGILMKILRGYLQRKKYWRKYFNASTGETFLNIETNGEIAHNEQFFFLPQC